MPRRYDDAVSRHCRLQLVCLLKRIIVPAGFEQQFQELAKKGQPSVISQ